MSGVDAQTLQAPMQAMQTMHGMTFTWQYDAVILFEGWQTRTASEFFVACIAVMCMSVGHQLSKAWLNEHSRHYRGEEERLTATLMHGVVMALSYLLMLVVMTFNMGLFFAVIFGQMLGFHIAGMYGGRRDVCFRTIKEKNEKELRIDKHNSLSDAI